MPLSTVRRLLPAVLAALALAVTFGIAGIVTPAAAAEKEKEAAKPLHRVEPKTVCMVNDQAMGKDQIPVEVEGRTYYGCCAMCKGRLAQDASVRTAVDPATGKKVDKAKAVIAAREDGSVLYFASEKTLAEYQAKTAKGGSGGRQ